jgi:amidase
MKHIALIAVLALAAGAKAPAQQKPATAPKPAALDVFEASIPEMQAAMKSGRTTSHAIVQQYLTRIAKYEDLLHAAITGEPEGARGGGRARP